MVRTFEAGAAMIHNCLLPAACPLTCLDGRRHRLTILGLFVATECGEVFSRVAETIVGRRDFPPAGWPASACGMVIVKRNDGDAVFGCDCFDGLVCATSSPRKLLPKCRCQPVQVVAAFFSEMLQPAQKSRRQLIGIAENRSVPGKGILLLPAIPVVAGGRYANDGGH